MKLFSYKHLVIATFFIQASLLLLSVDTHAQYTVLNNNKLRMGHGSENSVNNKGNLQQPFYYNSNSGAWRQLTFSNFALDNAYAIGGDKTNEWNTNGTIVQNPTLTGQTLNMSAYVVTGINNGYGRIVSKGTINIGGSNLEIENTYTLPQTSAYIEVKVKVKNVSTATVENVRIWIGTRDDFVGATDVPTKQRGNLTDQFVKLTDPAARSAALKIFTGDEGILFYTNSSRGNTIIDQCCSWSNVVSQDPATSAIEATDDGSYGFYVRMNDLAVGASDEFTWYYAAGELADIDAIIGEVAVASGTFTNLTAHTGTFSATASTAATGYWMAVPQGSAAPTAAQIKAGTGYGGVTVTANGAELMPADVEVNFNITGLAQATSYDFYFVTENATPEFSEVFTASFATHGLPTIETISDVTGCQNRMTAPNSITIGDAETAAASLILAATSSNTALIPNTNILLGGTGAARTIAMTPAPGQTGTSIITVRVTDGDGDTATETFTVTFNSTASPGVTDVTVYESATPVNLSAQATGSNLLWYTAESGGTGFSVAPAPSTAPGTQQFWVTQTVAGCESPRAKIMVTLNATEIAGNTEPTTAYYQFTSVVDDQIIVTGSDNIPAASVYIASGFSNGDELICTAAMPAGVTKSYNTATGELVFTGSASAAAWQTLFRNVRFRTASSNTVGRVVNFSLASAIEHAATLQYNTGAAFTLSNSAIDEGIAAESSVGTFTVSGAEAELTFTYQLVAGISDEDNTSFAVLNDGLKISVVPNYENRESYSIRVQVTDNFNKSYQQIFSVTVNNLNDTKPEITAGQSFDVDENSAAGTSVSFVQASDPDGATTFGGWAIIGGNTGGAFSIKPSTGEIVVADASAIDYEVVSTYTLVVKVDDGVNDSEPTEVVINLNNLNDTKPEITAGQTFDVDENSAAGTLVSYVQATDADGATTFEGWTISEGNIDGAFAIEALTGEIVVADASAIDYEALTSYILVLSVSDGIQTSERTTVTVNVNNLNDNQPEITAEQTFVVDENSAAGTSVSYVQATDADGATTFEGWTISEGNIDGAFAIEALTGEIVVADAAAIDYETLTSYTLLLSVSDGINTGEHTTVTVNVNNLNDNQPDITAGQAFTVDENSAAGTSVSYVRATDPDGATTFGGWAIIQGNTGGAFAIEPLTGEITVSDASAIDYEILISYTLLLSVSDGINTGDHTTVTINVNNLNDTKPEITAGQSFDVDENSAAGTSVSLVQASDPDGATTFGGWAIIGGNTGGAFAIKPSTGEIVVADASAIDYEVVSTYTLVVKVDDGVNDSEPTEVVINLNNLNDTRPEITAGQTFDVDENSAAGTSVSYVQATDADGATTFEGWTISEGNIDGAFAIEALTGEIVVADASAIDYEALTSYTLVLSVSDGIQTSERKTVEINVNNVNDNKPSNILLSNDRFSESVVIGTSIGTLSTVDLDMEGFHTYTLVTGEGDADNQKFDIDGDQLVSAASYNYDFQKSFTIRVNMTDNQGDSYEKVFTITPEADKDIQLQIPTAFSPNGDQVNDTWEIDRLFSYPKNVVKVFNSDGMEVFSNAGYTAQWDGTYKGQEQAFGAYYYIIRLNDASGKVFKGTVLIIK